MILDRQQAQQLMCSLNLSLGTLTLSSHSATAPAAKEHLTAQACTPARVGRAASVQLSTQQTDQSPAFQVLLHQRETGRLPVQAISCTAQLKDMADGFVIPPAVLDASLHLGAALAAAAGTAEARVPVGLAAYLAGSSVDADALTWCTAVPTRAEEGSAISSHRLAQPETRAGAAVLVHDLQVGMVMLACHA